MRGKDRFRKVAWLLNMLASAMRWMPVSMRTILWSLTSVFDGPIALAIRFSLLKSLIKSCGNNVFVGKYVLIRNWKYLAIGNNVSIHAAAYLDAAGGITIGDDVSIAHQVSLISSNYTFDKPEIPIKYNPGSFESIEISDDVWVGCGVRILAGVSIQSRSVIAAGAVLNRNVDANTIVGGVPAKVIGQVRRS